MPSGLTYLILGQPKTGKTTATSKWSTKGQDGVIILDADLGSDFVDGANTIAISGLNQPTRPVMHKGKQVTEKGIPKTEVIPPEERGFNHRSGADKGTPLPAYSMAEVYGWLNTEWDKLPYDTIVIDTVGQINEWIEHSVVHELGITAMGEGQWGADWGKARRRNLDIVKRFQTLIKKKGGNLVLVSHSKTSQLQDGKVQLAPELPRGLGYSLAAKADIIGYTTASKEDGKYYISFEAYDERVVGSRLKPLSQKVLLFDYEVISSEILNYKEEK
tara:strand:- start:4169 stop:4990 length:822 start_codon:yes stop_codon:yes gene_type:complete